MHTNHKKGSILTLLLHNYLIFTSIILFMLLFLFAFLLYRISSGFQSYDLSRSEKSNILLKKEDYSNYPVFQLLGKDGGIAILDENGKTIYNQSTYRITLTASELQYIPPYETISSFLYAKLTLPDGRIHHQITRDASTTDKIIQTETYLLDENYHLLYASGNYITSDLTQNEFSLLTQNYFKDCIVKQYQFQTRQNKNRTLLLFQPIQNGNVPLLQMGKEFTRCGLLFFLVYCGIVVCFILWLRRKIKTPLELLCKHLNAFDNGKIPEPFYHGPKEFIAIFNSFTAMASRLEQSEQERKKLESEKQTLFAGITHDLKTPITVVQGYAKAFCDGIIPPEQQPQYWIRILQKTNELTTLIHSFYEYNKLEHPDFQLDLECTDICNYFRNYIADQYSEWSSLGFSVEVIIPELHLFCQADHQQLKRVLDNLLGNALKYNPQGVPLYFELQSDGNAILLLIADNGIGIPPEIRSNLFSPFVTGDKSNKGCGSGLGLSIASKIVHAHGGSLYLTQIPDYSTAFAISLPQFFDSIQIE